MSDKAALLPQIADLLDTLAPFYGALRDGPLSEQDRKALSANLYDDAPRFVHATADALAQDPSVFTDIPIDPAALRQLQDRADALWDLRGNLRVLLTLCNDDYLQHQAEALGLALAAVKRVRQDAEILFNDDPRSERRALLMDAAEELAPRKGPYLTLSRLAAGKQGTVRK